MFVVFAGALCAGESSPAKAIVRWGTNGGWLEAAARNNPHVRYQPQETSTVPIKRVVGERVLVRESAAIRDR